MGLAEIIDYLLSKNYQTPNRMLGKVLVKINIPRNSLVHENDVFTLHRNDDVVQTSIGLFKELAKIVDRPNFREVIIGTSIDNNVEGKFLCINLEFKPNGFMTEIYL